MKKELPVVKEFEYDRIGSFREGNPYTIHFCYTSPKYFKHEGFIVKGGSKPTRKYIKENLGFPMIVFTTWWWHGHSRHMGPLFENFKDWSESHRIPYACSDGHRRLNKKQMKYYSKYWTIRFGDRKWLRFRRIPRKWLPEYDEMIKYLPSR